MDDLLLTAAIVGSRQAYEKLMGIGLDSTDFTEGARCIVVTAGEQYKRDPAIQAVNVDVLRSQIQRRYGDGAMSNSIMDFVATFPRDVSKFNVTEEYRLHRLGRCATLLATNLATGNYGDETGQLVDKYKQLSGGEEGEQFKARLTEDDFADDDQDDKLELSPRSLNEFIGGGVRRGNNITVYGRPESAKTLFALNQAATSLMHGHRVLYVANEEPAHDITIRLLSRLAMRDVDALRDKSTLRDAFARTREPYNRWYLLHRAGCTARDISRQAARLKPDLIIVDQLKNLSVGRYNRALELDRVAQAIREIGIEHECVTLSITQAGDSAQDVLNLKMNDIEWSNTGIPGAADLMIGIGVNDEYQAIDKRMLSIPKNKINGAHGAFPVWIDTQQTKYLSRARV